MNMLKPSWRTSLAGIGGIVAAVGGAVKAQFDGDPNTVPDWNTVVTLMLGIGLLFARDNKVSSEQAGLK